MGDAKKPVAPTSAAASAVRKAAGGLRPVVTIDDMRARAKRRLPRMVFDFIDGGAETEWTQQRNRTAFGDVVLRPRVLRDVAKRDQSVVVLGRELQTPVLLAPTGMARLCGRGGELAAARGAEDVGSVAVIGTSSSVAIGEIARGTTTPPWFQLYPWGDREMTLSLIRAAKDAGAEALVVTVDVPVVGGRERDLRNGFVTPLRKDIRTALDVARHPRWLAEIATQSKIRPENIEPLFPAFARRTQDLVASSLDLLNPGHTWQDLDWMREAWGGPVIVKGIMTAEDALLARSAGVDGIVVSNHGGRQCDGIASSIEVLPEIVAAVGADMPVLLDSGVRRGTDVVKAIALGATAVLIGRPWMFGLAAVGAAGPRRALEILRDEIDRTMGLVGVVSLAELGSEHVARAASPENTWKG